MTDKATLLALAERVEKADGDCESCNGLNTSCPVACGRDPVTGELDGSTFVRAQASQK